MDGWLKYRVDVSRHEDGEIHVCVSDVGDSEQDRRELCWDMVDAERIKKRS